MAFITMEGFGGSTFINNFQNNNPARRYANTTYCSILTGMGPRATYGMRVANDSLTLGTWGLDLEAAGGLGPLVSGGVLGARMSFSSVSSGQYGVVNFKNSNGSSIEFCVQRASDGTVNLRRGNGAGTIVASSSAGAIPADTVGYFETKWNGIGISQNVTVRWNGSAIITATAVNIQGGTGTHTCGVIEWAGRMDTQDLYLIDLSGGSLNDFLGDMQVWSFLPTASTATAWTPLSSTNLAMIGTNLNPFPQPTAYNKAASANLEDLFSFSPGLSGSQVISAVQSKICTYDSSASGATVAARLKSGGTTYSGATGTPPITTPTYQTDVWLTDPATSAAWTLAALNAAQMGYKTVAVTSGEARAAQVMLEVLLSGQQMNASMGGFMF